MRIGRFGVFGRLVSWARALSLALLLALAGAGVPAAAQTSNGQYATLIGNLAAPQADVAPERNATGSPDDAVSDAGEEFDLPAMGKALFAALIMAVVLESALALVFNWRPFVRTFDGRGVKSVIALAGAMAFVRYTDLDLLSIFEKAMDGASPQASVSEGWFGSTLTAMVVAGGSAGVNRLLVALGFRSVLRAEEVFAKPAKDKAWVSVRIERANDDDPRTVFVMLKEAGGEYRLIGQISGRSRPPDILRWALQDRTRFPAVAGYSLAGDRGYELELRDDVKGSGLPNAQWGPVMVASGAIVDLLFKV